jgi:hypothetical protein
MRKKNRDRELNTGRRNKRERGVGTEEETREKWEERLFFLMKKKGIKRDSALGENKWEPKG